MKKDIYKVSSVLLILLVACILNHDKNVSGRRSLSLMIKVLIGLFENEKWTWFNEREKKLKLTEKIFFGGRRLIFRNAIAEIEIWRKPWSPHF